MSNPVDKLSFEARKHWPVDLTHTKLDGCPDPVAESKCGRRATLLRADF